MLTIRTQPKRLGQLTRKLGRLMPAALERANQDAAAKAVRILQEQTRVAKPRPPIFTGRFIRGWMAKGTGSSMAITNPAIYAPVIEYGRRVGAKMPPPSALIPWVRKRLGKTGKEAVSAAWALAKAISRRGQVGRRIATNSIPLINTMVTSVMTNAVAKAERDTK